jgi:hypothetical protein
MGDNHEKSDDSMKGAVMVYAFRLFYPDDQEAAARWSFFRYDRFIFYLGDGLKASHIKVGTHNQCFNLSRPEAKFLVLGWWI